MTDRLKIGINDIVEVIDDGCLYSTYQTMAEFMLLKNWLSRRLMEYEENTNLYRVVFIQPHDVIKTIKMEDLCNYNALLCGIENLESLNQYIIGIEGLKLKRKAFSSPMFNEDDFLL